MRDYDSIVLDLIDCDPADADRADALLHEALRGIVDEPVPTGTRRELRRLSEALLLDYYDFSGRTLAPAPEPVRNRLGDC